MLLRIVLLLALFVPSTASLAAAEKAAGTAGADVTMLEDLNILDLPTDNILWHVERSAQPRKAHEIFRDVSVMADGHVVFAGQMGDENGKWEQSAYMALYDKSGALKAENLSALAGFQTIYDIQNYDDVLIAMGYYSEPQSADDLWGAADGGDDKIFIRIYDAQLQNLLHEIYLEDLQGGLYSPRMVAHDGALYFKALQRNAQMQESTILYTLDIALNDGDYTVLTREIGRYAGRSYDVVIDNDALYASGQADEARLIKQPIKGQMAETLAVASEAVSEKVSNFSALIASADHKIWVAGEWQGQNKREGIFGHFDAAGDFFLKQHFAAQDKALFSAKRLIDINETTMAALYFLEPEAQDQPRFSLLMFLSKKSGALCQAYRLGDAQNNNILAYNGAYQDGVLYIAGALAPKLSGRLSGSRLQKARFMAYNAYGLVINVKGLETCP